MSGAERMRIIDRALARCLPAPKRARPRRVLARRLALAEVLQLLRAIGARLREAV